MKKLTEIKLEKNEKSAFSSPLNIDAKDWRGGMFTEFLIYNEILKDGVVCYEMAINNWLMDYCIEKKSASLLEWI